jgi:hypothetical protein
VKEQVNQQSNRSMWQSELSLLFLEPCLTCSLILKLEEMRPTSTTLSDITLRNIQLTLHFSYQIMCEQWQGWYSCNAVVSVTTTHSDKRTVKPKLMKPLLPAVCIKMFQFNHSIFGHILNEVKQNPKAKHNLLIRNFHILHCEVNI